MFTLKQVEINLVYTVSDVEPVRDSAGCPINPDEVTVSFRSRSGQLRPTFIEIMGRRLRGAKTAGTYNRGGFSIQDDGTVEPDYRRGVPPAWVQAAVDQAIARHRTLLAVQRIDSATR